MFDRVSFTAKYAEDAEIITENERVFLCDLSDPGGDKAFYGFVKLQKETRLHPIFEKTSSTEIPSMHSLLRSQSRRKQGEQSIPVRTTMCDVP